MSEVKKIATRESYGHALVELGKEHEEVVVLDADLAEATKTGIFKKEFPERHIDCGIAECNMTDQKQYRLSASECEDRCHPCRHFCW